MEKEKRVNVGVIGLGRIGKVHAENLAYFVKNARVSAMVERKEQIPGILNFAAELGVENVTNDYKELLADKDIDAVVICSSTNTHARIIIDAAQAGKHIFCEKPIDHDLKKIDEALRAVKKAGVKFQVGFNRRFDPDFARIKEIIENDKMGNIRKINIISRDPSPPPIEYIKVSGGIFKDMTIHDFDMARFLAGSEPIDIQINGGVVVDPEIGKAGDIDRAEIIINFENGVVATIDNCRHSAINYDQRVEVVGSEKNCFNENIRENNVLISDHRGERRAPILDFFIERYEKSYIIEMRAFIDAVRNNTPTPVSGNDGRVPILMAMAAEKSLKAGRWVKISEIK